MRTISQHFPFYSYSSLLRFSHRLSTATKQEKSLIFLVKSSSQITHLPQIHAHLIISSLFQNPNISLAFLSRISSNTTYTYTVFTQLWKPTISHYNAVIRAFSQSNFPEGGFELYREMRRKSFRPDTFSLSFVIKCFAQMGSLFGGELIHGTIFRCGFSPDSLLLTTLMDLYSNRGKGNEACKVFEEMSQRDTVAWNVLINCYICNGRTREAFRVFDMMEKGQCGSRPDDVTCLLLLQACGNLNSLEFGERVHDYIRERGYENITNICNAVIAMYSRCGCVEKAYQVFKAMPNKNVVSWTAMISGLARNGYGREAIEAFTEMQRLGISPDDHTITGVLSACGHAGMVDEGLNFFESMTEKFNIIPNVHHYGCIVDLLGRAGQLEKAYNLILSMDVKPDATIWRTLLGACRIHRHVTLGESVIERLIVLKAQEAGDFILLLNMYSSVGDWEKVIDVRKSMKEKGIQTSPGCSTIELRGEIHEFVVDDISHPRKREIYDTLDDIEKQLKIAGYVVEVTSELHNVCDKGKEMGLSNHSEKIAIAFGVLATPPGTPIRVAKNLRTCVDCHNFAKFVSSVYSREIVIRDRTRFHHFRVGYCSCNDYW